MDGEHTQRSSRIDGADVSVESLIQRLASTEAALEALLTEQVDAVLDPRSGTPILLRNAQEALRETNQLLEQIFSNIYIGIAYMDVEFNFIRVNLSYAVANQHPPEYFTGKNHFALFPSAENEAIFRQAVETGEAVSITNAPFSSNLSPERGTTYWNWSLQPIRDAQGRVSCLLLTTVDVTEQNRAELALRESQAMFANLFEGSPDAHILLDGDGIIQAVNLQTEAAFCYSRDDLVGSSVDALIQPEDGKDDPKFYEADLRSGPRYLTAPMIGHRKNDTCFPVDIVLSPVMFGSSQRILCVARDISAQVEAENALKIQTGFMRLLQDIAVAANQAQTLEEALQYALDRICAHTGWPVGHALLRNPRNVLISTSLWHLNDPQRYARFQHATLTSEWSNKIGLPVRIMQQGRPDWVADLEKDADFRRKEIAREVGLKSAMLLPIIIGEEVAGVLEFFSDERMPPDQELLQVMAHIGTQLGRVLERENSRRALQRSEARFRTIFEESAIGIQLTDPQGFLVESNPALQAMLGYSAEELRHFGLTEIMHPEELERNWQLLKSLLQSERDQFQVETRYIRKDGSVLWAELVVSLAYDDQGLPQFVVTLVNDITLRKDMEGELDEVKRRLQEGAEAERLRLAMELHDGPLQDLYGATFQLQDVIPSLTDAAMISSARNAQAIIQQVISTLRTTVGELRPPTLIPFGLEKAIRSHVERWRQIYPNLELHLELMSDGLTLTEKARLALFRAYQQLLSNVARHANAKNVWVRLEIQPEDIVLEVEDDGKGFHLPTRWVEMAREGHTGLLGISERVDAFGGSMWIDTRLEHGTLVRISIPRLAAER